MRLRTMGELSIEGNAFKGTKPLLLLSYLAVEGPKERRFLMELFWRDAKNAQTSLSTTMMRLRKADPHLVGSDDVTLRCEVESDVRDLLEALDHKRNERAAELYSGPFLAGVDPSAAGVELEEWIYSTRESLGARVRLALLDLAEEQAGAGEFRVGAELAQRAYLLPGAPEPEGEELERLFVLLTAGEHGEAYEVRKEARAFELDLSLSTEDARAALREDQDTTTTLAQQNLPTRATRFVGRERELSEISELLAQPDCRLLSLVGVGGVGKTRLALEAAQEKLEQGGFPDGVVIVPLEALTDAGSIPAVVAGALGLTLTGQEDTRSVVLRFLEGKRLLLVLDNFEHLLEGASFVGELTLSCPQMKLLITTRERLNLEAEWVFQVEGLSYPEETATLEHAGYFDAVQLFRERARQVQPGFSLTSDVLSAVMRICRLAEGMPLAIELASNWLRALPAGEIASEIEAGTDRLESLAWDVPARHRSVGAVFDHSWSLLSEGEREVLRRLSVFRGGFTRAAAAEVAGASLPVLARLVDASLLSMSPEGRYDRHPLLSAYTREKLAESPEERAEAEQGHGAYFLGLVRELEPALWTRKSKAAVRAFQEELANVRAAWDWAVANQRADEIERTTPALYDFFHLHFQGGLEHFGTTFEFFGSVAERLDETNPDHLSSLGTVLVHQALHSRFMHRVLDVRRVRTLAERGIELLKSQGDHWALARGYCVLATCFWEAGELGKENECLQQALAIARRHGRPNDIFYALRALAMMRKGRIPQRGRFGQFLQEALEELRELNHLPGVTYFLAQRAWTILLPEQRFEEAEALLREANRLAWDLGHEEFIIRTLDGLGAASVGLGEVDQAAAYARQAHQQAEETGSALLLSETLVRLGRVATAQGDFEGARKLLLRSMKMSWAREDRYLVRVASVYLAELWAAEGNPGEAVALLALVEGEWNEANRVLAELEGSLTPEEFAAAVERGRGMTLDEVVRELLPEL